MKQESLLKTLLSTYVSEKAASKPNVYVFKVINSAIASNIKDAVETLFNTKVRKVNCVNVIEKKKTFRGMSGKRKGWKKAYVTLQDGCKIDAFEVKEA